MFAASSCVSCAQGQLSRQTDERDVRPWHPYANQIELRPLYYVWFSCECQCFRLSMFGFSQVHSIFSPYGTVVEVNIIRDKFTNAHKGLMSHPFLRLRVCLSIYLRLSVYISLSLSLVRSHHHTHSHRPRCLSLPTAYTMQPSKNQTPRLRIRHL